MEDDLPDYVWEAEPNLEASDFNIPIMLEDTLSDLEVLAEFIDDLMSIDSDNDDKINSLKEILLNDERVKDKKIIIFSEYRSTAQYIYRQLKKCGIENLYELDGQTKGSRKDII